MRAPAEGLWVPQGSETKRDDIVTFEVMASKIDEKWWSEYRKISREATASGIHRDTQLRDPLALVWRIRNSPHLGAALRANFGFKATLAIY